MNCIEVSAILDAHRSARLSAAERANVDAHLATCEDCDAAWHAHTELHALRVPAVPATLLERVLLAAPRPVITQPRRAWRPIAVGATLLAGAALAGIAVVTADGPPVGRHGGGADERSAGPGDRNACNLDVGPCRAGVSQYSATERRRDGCRARQHERTARAIPTDAAGLSPGRSRGKPPRQCDH